MKFFIQCLIAALFTLSTFAANDFFYCGFANLDGSAQDYAKWGKGTDFKFNPSKNRWEWVTDYTYQYIYPDGRYEQIPRKNIFDEQRGQCNADMEKIYKQRMAELMKRNSD